MNVGPTDLTLSAQSIRSSPTARETPRISTLTNLYSRRLPQTFSSLPRGSYFPQYFAARPLSLSCFCCRLSTRQAWLDLSASSHLYSSRSIKSAIFPNEHSHCAPLHFVHTIVPRSGLACLPVYSVACVSALTYRWNMTANRFGVAARPSYKKAERPLNAVYAFPPHRTFQTHTAHANRKKPARSMHMWTFPKGRKKKMYTRLHS